MKTNLVAHNRKGQPLNRAVAGHRNLILAAIVDFSEDAIISKDLDGIITSWNKSAERMFGYSPSEMIGHPVQAIVPPGLIEQETEVLARLLKGERVDNFETKRITKAGTILDVSLTISPIRDDSGSIIGFSKIVRDVTAKKQEEQRKGDFVAMVSHELKTPLAIAGPCIELLLRKAKKEGDKSCIDLLSKLEIQIEKMTKMVCDFLDISSLEEGKMTLDISQFGLAEFMDEVVSDASSLWPSHRIRYEGGLDAKLYADRAKIAQVMTNLLSNAVKYSPIGSNITVRCISEGQKIRFSVTDEGIGISPEYQKKLFDRFYRVHAKSAEKVSGFGIGLYFCSEILRMHGSEIAVSSSSGASSTFSFGLNATDIH